MADRQVSNATLNLAINSLKFYYTQVLKRKFFFDIKHPKKEKRLPVILTKDEIRSMLEVTKNLKHKLLMEIMYASGLRVSEVIKLKMKNIDLEEGIIRVNLAKGEKDRQTILSKRAIEDLKTFLETRKDDNQYLFTGAQNKGHLSTRSAQKIVLQAAKLAGIKKDISCHNLRHSFATHLLEKGVDIRYIQKLLGHKRLETTQIYTQVSTQKLKEIGSPLDDL
ncbi:tyrosine-type recombinase/integrase [Candidatus Acetothermia bacterium]|nr:tyrosine-type recombinase/integrase [Candidatus Acetothermia bacterium]